MVVSAPPMPEAVVWHDLECGAYRADLQLWHELAGAAPPGPILDVGAGTGRVALSLARAGRRVIALDRDPVLLQDLCRRAAGLPVQTVCADARLLAPAPEWDLALCIVPMQTLQLFGAPEQRAAFLRWVRAHLQPGALLAAALVQELEPFDVAAGEPAPAAETCLVDGVLYRTQATRVTVRGEVIVIERERRVGAGPLVHDLVELGRLTCEQLEQEGAAVGLHPEIARHVPPTDDHLGSAVVILRA